MDQYVNNGQSQFLYKLIADPANHGQEYMNDLQQLVKNFPQSGLLQALLAHANGSQTIHQAATYFDPATLHKVIKHPADLPVIAPGKVFYQANVVGSKYHPQPLPPEPETTDTTIDKLDVVVIDDKAPATSPVEYADSIAENAEQLTEEVAVTGPEAIIEEEAIPDDDLQASEEVVEPPVYEDIYPVQEETVKASTPAEPIAVVEEKPAAENVAYTPYAQSVEITEVPDGDLQAAEEVVEPPVYEDIYWTPEPPVEKVVTEAPAAIEENEVPEEEITPVVEETPVEIEETPAVAEDEQVIEEVIVTEKNAPVAEEEPLVAIEDVPVEFAEARFSIEGESIEDEVYDEIVGIDDIHIDEIKQTAGNSPEAAMFTFEDPFSAQETDHLVSEVAPLREDEIDVDFIDDEEIDAIIEDSAQTDHGFSLNDEADKLIVGNIAATDYFMFDRAFTREG
ncbi:MAG: hypothetical protein EOO88_43760, partial [Pedobacter sp.]